MSRSPDASSAALSSRLKLDIMILLFICVSLAWICGVVGTINFIYYEIKDWCQ